MQTGTQHLMLLLSLRIALVGGDVLVGDGGALQPAHDSDMPHIYSTLRIIDQWKLNGRTVTQWAEAGVTPGNDGYGRVILRPVPVTPSMIWRMNPVSHNFITHFAADLSIDAQDTLAAAGLVVQAVTQGVLPITPKLTTQAANPGLLGSFKTLQAIITDVRLHANALGGNDVLDDGDDADLSIGDNIYGRTSVSQLMVICLLAACRLLQYWDQLLISPEACSCPALAA